MVLNISQLPNIGLVISILISSYFLNLSMVVDNDCRVHMVKSFYPYFLNLSMVVHNDRRVHMVKSFYPYATTHKPLGTLSQSKPQKENALRGDLDDHFSK